jgi:uncharacterized tellurite resistance protein B-like protein
MKMSQTVHPGPTASSDDNSATAIRSMVHELGALDRATAGFLNALAFVLVRVADVDQHISRHERDRIELLLVEHAGLTRAQAVLVVEIAKHRARLADCGCSYGISRQLRGELDLERRRGILVSLYAVADADGLTTALEAGEIRQIAHELGLTIDDLEA